jgi:hypothetical protein
MRDLGVCALTTSINCTTNDDQCGRSLPLLLQSPVATVTSILASQLNLLYVGVTVGVASSRSSSNGRTNRCVSGVAVVVVRIVVVAGVVVAVVCIGSSSRSSSSSRSLLVIVVVAAAVRQ